MLQEQIKALGIEESLHIEKPVSDIQNKYLESDFLILSSRYEGFGMVLIEAMACGIPCVSFESSSTNDMTRMSRASIRKRSDFIISTFNCNIEECCHNFTLLCNADMQISSTISWMIIIKQEY